ncbi:MAG TPA: hypothetical protein VE547_06785 [Mycobacteriales bacterium]|nr:hypothetical protein [Mycobacteriales bacterium]
MDPDPSRFRALARSSPWRWRSARFTVSWRGWGAGAREPVRAWVRRPGMLRVETLAGHRLTAESARPPVTMVEMTSDGRGRPVEVEWASAAAPVLDADGLVAERPSRRDRPYADPMFQDYRWIAMLDPVELAVGSPDELDEPDEPGDPVAVDEVRAVAHGGRPAWEAVLRPRPAYDPTCSCCPLLFSAESERWEAGASGRTQDPTLVYATAHRVRLDLGTGICVLAEELGGSHAGAGHDLRLESVDEPLPDALFRR